MRRILVVDDSLLVREAARIWLESDGGFVVQTVASGAAGIEAARAQPPDAILLDVVMPDMDGPQTVHALREHAMTREIPVVLVTGRDGDQDRLAFAELGVAGVIGKPFDGSALAGQVRGVLGWGP